MRCARKRSGAEHWASFHEAATSALEPNRNIWELDQLGPASRLRRVNLKGSRLAWFRRSIGCGGLLLACGWLLGCGTTRDAAAEAGLYLFPKRKYVATAEFSLSNAERKVALREMRWQGGELLYELVIDRSGNVVRIRVAKALAGEDNDFFTIGFMQRLRDHKFLPSRMEASYRTFFYPMSVRWQTEFLGADSFLD